uniref:Uncharacterized protein n=1 Tax=Brassica oleracea var. oleracea TaxID=109376 RepID=A0A0D3ED30_BRAOL
SVPKKKGRLVGLGRRTRSVPPSSAPPPFVDPKVLTAQLKDKDDRISLLETQMAAQQAGYEAQSRLNQQMMEMMQRMYPNEVFPDVPDLIYRGTCSSEYTKGPRSSEYTEGPRSSEYTEGHVPRNIPRDMFLGIFRGTPFLGIFRGTRSSEFSDENSEEHFVGTSEDWTIGKSIEISRGSSPSVYSKELSDEQVVLGFPRNSVGKFRGISEEK